ncbi:MAG: hypothetical protein HFH49_13095 [Lachnospiraceae bacterium]|nr:hypothetical protein [Lachnospiraceae bacterium]
MEKNGREIQRLEHTAETYEKKGKREWAYEKKGKGEEHYGYARQAFERAERFRHLADERKSLNSNLITCIGR